MTFSANMIIFLIALIDQGTLGDNVLKENLGSAFVLMMHSFLGITMILGIFNFFKTLVEICMKIRKKSKVHPINKTKLANLKNIEAPEKIFQSNLEKRKSEFLKMNTSAKSKRKYTPLSQSNDLDIRQISNRRRTKSVSSIPFEENVNISFLHEEKKEGNQKRDRET